MSNPLRAPRQPLSAMQRELSIVPQAYFSDEQLTLLGRDAKTGKLGKKGISIEEANSYLIGLDMAPVYSFYLGTECLEPALQHALALKGKVLATAQLGAACPRVRTSFAMKVASALYAGIVPWRGISAAEVADRCSQVVYVQGGTACTLGRLKEYYPKSNRTRVLTRITKAETREAIVRCGLEMNSEMKRCSFTGEPGFEAVRINPDSDNGFPFGSKWSNELTHSPILRKASEIREAICRAYQRGGRAGVVQWLRDMESSPETLKYVALKGKCKADPYKTSKVVERKMRFYNVFPRQVALNLMVVSQTMDEHSQHIRPKNTRLKSAIGVSLVRGGADELVSALDWMLADDGAGYTHTGDDTWVVAEYESGLLLFSIDCSAYDLTQREEVTMPIHTAIADELEKIDGPAASLWYAYARERVVVTVNSQTYRWKHGGASGFPLQSKINDVLMDVFCQRVLGELVDRLEVGEKSVPTQVQLDEVLKKVSQGLGLQARLEEYKFIPGVSSVREALETTTFLYVGYNFYAQDGKVYVVADLPRQISQMQYPSSFWVEREKLMGMEAVRLAGVLISFGLVPQEWRAGYDAAREVVCRFLEMLINNQADDSGMRYLPDNAFVGLPLEDVASYRGLLSALQRDPKLLWSAEGEMEATESVLVPVTVEVSEALSRAPPLEPVRPPTHPATMLNLGRPPPHVRWNPPKRPKSEYGRVLGYRRQANRDRFGATDGWLEGFDEYEDYESEGADWDEGSYGAFEVDRGYDSGSDIYG